MKKIELSPIAQVYNDRKEIKDDDWGEVVSEIRLVEEIPARAFQGIDTFSHLEIIFHFDKADINKIKLEALHPRGDTSFPKLGIFAQRKKYRPNMLGLTIVEIMEHKGKSIFVKGLDAIDGSPILDIKPVMQAFLPRKEVVEPAWVKELMKNYW